MRSFHAIKSRIINNSYLKNRLALAALNQTARNRLAYVINQTARNRLAYTHNQTVKNRAEFVPNQTPTNSASLGVVSSSGVASRVDKKFVIMPTIRNVTGLICNFINGSTFYFPSTVSTVITDINFTNIPVIIQRRIKITVIIENTQNTVVSWLNPAFSTIGVNGQAIVYKTKDGDVFHEPIAPESGYWQVVHQFILLFTSDTLSPTNPRIIGSISTIK